MEHQAWALFGHAIHLLRRNRAAAALPMLSEARNLFQGVTGSRLAEMDNLGALALAQLRLDDLDAAQATVEAAARLQAETPPTAFAALDGYTHIAEVYLALWERSLGDDALAITPPQPQAKRAITALRAYARIYPIGRPVYWRCRGRYDWLRGKSKAAHTAWQRALTIARQLRTPYDEALTHLEIARRLPPHSPLRDKHQSQGRALLASLGVEGDGG